MAARRIDVRRADPGEPHGHWQKAQEWADVMTEALKVRRLNAATLLAIHASIAACDAFTIRHKGVRASSERHLDAVHLFSGMTAVPGVKVAARHLDYVLTEKGWIEYSGRAPHPDEADRLCMHAGRFIEFVGKNLG